MAVFENIHTTLFTPRDYQTELLAAAFENNIMVCLGHKSSKEFISLKLLQETAGNCSKHGMYCIYLTLKSENSSMYTMLTHLTNLKVHQVLDNMGSMDTDFPKETQVYILSPKQLSISIRNGSIKTENIYSIILEDCHLNVMYIQLCSIFKEFFEGKGNYPKILGLGGPLHNCSCPIQDLNAMIQSMENNLHCKAETASDIIYVLR